MIRNNVTNILIVISLLIFVILLITFYPTNNQIKNTEYFYLSANKHTNILNTLATTVKTNLISDDGLGTQIFTDPLGTIDYTKTTDFGYVSDAVHKDAWHNGYDLAPTDKGTDHPILAVGAGEIVWKKWDANGYGNYVVIKHSTGHYTLYGHMRDPALVQVGDTVTQGQQIGIVGTTGYSTGIHLHYAVYSPNAVNSKNDPLSTIFDNLMTEDPIITTHFNKLTSKYHTVLIINQTNFNLRNTIIELAKSKIGKPYPKVGQPTKGPEIFDCSGLIYWSVKEAGLNVKFMDGPTSRMSQNTFYNITKIDINDAKAGDLLFWSEKHTTDTIQHVGFFLDAEHCIDSATGKGVAIRNITSGWYKDNLVAVGKIPGIDN